MSPLFATTFGLATLVLTFLVGSFISHRAENFLTKHFAAFIAFASGVMLAVVFSDVLPHVVEEGNTWTWPVILSGILLFFILENFLLLHTCPNHTPGACQNHAVPKLMGLGLGLHAFFDGALVVLTFLIDLHLGWLTTLGIALHRLPAGAILHTITHHPQQSNWHILISTAFAPALALIIIPLTEKLSPAILNLGLAFSTGALLYITLSDLIPEAHRTRGKFNLIWLIIGLTLIFSLNYFHQH